MNTSFLHTSSSEHEWVTNVVREITANLPSSPTFVLSGGSTPAPVYEALSRENISWQNTNVFLADERYVLPNHQDSNQKLITKHFQAPAQWTWWNTHIPWEQCAQEYNTLLQCQNITPDVSILGMGNDGHTASLFPFSGHDSDLLADTAITDAFAIRQRLTMTPKMILSSRKIILLLKGESKKEALDELLSGEKSQKEFPAKMLLRHKNVHIYFCSF